MERNGNRGMGEYSEAELEHNNWGPLELDPNEENLPEGFYVEPIHNNLVEINSGGW